VHVVKISVRSGTRGKSAAIQRGWGVVDAWRGSCSTDKVPRFEKRAKKGKGLGHGGGKSERRVCARRQKPSCIAKKGGIGRRPVPKAREIYIQRDLVISG